MAEHLTKLRALLLVFVTFLGAGGAGAAQDPPSPASEAQAPGEAVTTQDVKIPVAELKLRVKPMTAEELSAEAVAWMKLLRAKAKKIAAAEVAVQRTNKAMAAAKESDAAGAAEEVKKAAEEVTKAEDEAAAAEAEAGVQSKEGADGAAEEPEEAAASAETAAEAAERANSQDAEAVHEVAAEAKEGLLENLNQRRTERTALIDRLNVVLDSWEAKGGEVEPYRLYIKEVAGIEVDVSDAAAAWAVVSGWILSEEGGQRWMWNIVKFVGVIFATWLAARGLGWFFHKALSRTAKRMSKLAERAIIRSIKMLVWVIGLVMALSMLEVDITPLIAAIGAAGLVVGLALQGTLSNIASGVMILINRPFDVDDVVSAGGVTGKVSMMTLVSTIFRTFDNQTVVVPNNQIWGQVITNITANRTRRVDMTFGVGYGDDLDLAEKIIWGVVKDCDLVLDDPEPIIKVHELGDSSVNFICRPWAKTKDYWDVMWYVTREIKRRFDAEGVSIPFPQRDVHFYRESGEDPATETENGKAVREPAEAAK